MIIHRNSQKRFYSPGKIYYVVSKTYKNFPFFEDELFCDLFIEELRLCKELKQFKLYAFSIMYDHLNLLLEPREKFNISQVIKSIKENFSRDANKIVLNDFEYLHEGDTSTC
ncbi:transposase, partial [Candidatus Kuenenbacteria bacterium]|nr:transposase [Candidatus Kuenenbacteria bacterium]